MVKNEGNRNRPPSEPGQFSGVPSASKLKLFISTFFSVKVFEGFCLSEFLQILKINFLIVYFVKMEIKQASSGEFHVCFIFRMKGSVLARFNETLIKPISGGEREREVKMKSAQ